MAPRQGIARVLIVDDSNDFRALLVSRLHGKGLEIHEAENGRTAVDSFEQNAYGLVIMDVEMPVLDGRAAARAMRAFEKQHRRPRTPIVILSALSGAAEKRSSLRAGADAHRVKPLSKADLQEVLDQYLGSYVRAAADPEPSITVVRGDKRYGPRHADGSVPALPPADEKARLAALRESNILDTGPEEVYDDLTRLAAAICGVPVALVSLVDENRQWFKSRVGLDAAETPRHMALCAHAIHHPQELFEIQDATLDPRFDRNPLITKAPNIRFYAGAPILSEEGLALGTLCVIDSKPHALTNAQRDSLRALARVASELLKTRRVRARLHESENRFHEMADIAPVFLGISDATPAITFANRAWSVYCGVDPGELTGTGWLKFIHPDDVAHVASISSGTKPHEIEYRLLRNDGQYRWVRHSAVCRPSRSGQFDGFIATAVDVHDQREYARNLELEVAERTSKLREISAERMRIEKEMAQKVVRAKDEFLATMSHEIRTPMNAIIGLSGLLAETKLSPEQSDFVHSVRVNCEHLLTLINDILDFSKIEAGKLKLERREFELEECVEEALDLVGVKASEKGLDLGYEIEPGTPAVLTGDITRVRQVLSNLLSNAVKFTARGEVKIRVSARRLEELLFEYRVEISDTGIGISDAELATLFQPFTQVDSSTTRKFGGTGLGLSICKRLTEMMGGSIGADSVVGRGSVFYFTFTAEAHPDRRERSRLLNLDLSKYRLLCVDDNPTNLRILEGQLETWAAKPITAKTPEEALSWIERGDHFDLALLDFNMPNLNGLDLASALRDRLRGRPLPILVLTSAQMTVAQRRLASGLVQSVMTKPVKKLVLGRAIQSALGLDEQEEAVETTPRGPAEIVPLRILLADDFSDNVKLALHFLRGLGYPNVDVATNGVEVLQALERGVYDVVLMDVLMPEMDGFEATREIHDRWPKERRPRIIAMTASAMEGDRERCLEAGMDDYVSKPIRIDQLREALLRSTPEGSQAP